MTRRFNNGYCNFILTDAGRIKYFEKMFFYVDKVNK